MPEGLLLSLLLSGQARNCRWVKWILYFSTFCFPQEYVQDSWASVEDISTMSMFSRHPFMHFTWPSKHRNGQQNIFLRCVPTPDSWLVTRWLVMMQCGLGQVGALWLTVTCLYTCIVVWLLYVSLGMLTRNCLNNLDSCEVYVYLSITIDSNSRSQKIGSHGVKNYP